MDDRDRAFTDYVHARAGTMLRTAGHPCAGGRAVAEDLVRCEVATGTWERASDAVPPTRRGIVEMALRS